MGAMKDLLLELADHPYADAAELFQWGKASPEAVRAEARRRAKYQCQDCTIGAADVRLELHHRHYRSVGRELPSDYALLCRDCHQERHEGPYGFEANPEEVEFQWDRFISPNT